MINIGNMREKITLQKRELIIENGFKKKKWNDYYSCRAELLDLFGTEKYSAYQSKLENSIKFKCRQCEKLRILIGLYNELKEYRLVWNKLDLDTEEEIENKAYDIIFVDSLNGSRTEFILQVKKVI